MMGILTRMDGKNVAVQTRRSKIRHWKGQDK